MNEPVTSAGKRFVYGSSKDMTAAYGHGWSLPQVLADIERETLILAFMDLARQIKALPRQTVHADPFFSETYDYETVGLDAVLAIIGSKS